MVHREIIAPAENNGDRGIGPSASLARVRYTRADYTYISYAILNHDTVYTCAYKIRLLKTYSYYVNRASSGGDVVTARRRAARKNRQNRSADIRAGFAACTERVENVRARGETV